MKTLTISLVIFLVLFLLNMGTAAEAELKDKSVAYGDLFLSDLVKSPENLPQDTALTLKIEPGYNYLTSGDILRNLKREGLTNLKIGNSGTTLYYQAEKPAEIALPWKNTPEELPEDQLEAGEQTPPSAARKSYTFPARYAGKKVIPPGARVDIHIHLSRSMITLKGKLMGPWQDGRRVKIKIQNSDKITEEQIFFKNLKFL